MNFENSKKAKKLGEKFGFLLGYFLFTALLYFILLFLKKIPQNWSYWDILTITLGIVLLGLGIKRLLK